MCILTGKGLVDTSVSSRYDHCTEERHQLKMNLHHFCHKLSITSLELKVVAKTLN